MNEKLLKFVLTLSDKERIAFFKGYIFARDEILREKISNLKIVEKDGSVRDMPPLPEIDILGLSDKKEQI